MSVKAEISLSYFFCFLKGEKGNKQHPYWYVLLEGFLIWREA